MAAECGEVSADDVDVGDLAVFDLGDSGLGDTEGVGDLGLGQAAAWSPPKAVRRRSRCWPTWSKRPGSQARLGRTQPVHR